MALPDFFKIGEGTAKTVKSGGTAGITLASLANGNTTTAGARQSATLDLGALWAERWRVDCQFDVAATPTAGSTINIYVSYSSTTGAGLGNTSGTDATYTGYSSNKDASIVQLEFLGAHVCSATTGAQRSLIGTIFPKGRYLNFVIDNRSGAAVSAPEANQFLTITPLEQSLEDTV